MRQWMVRGKETPWMSFSEWQQNKEITGGEGNSFTSSVAFVRLESAFWGEGVWTQSSLAVCAGTQSSPYLNALLKYIHPIEKQKKDDSGGGKKRKHNSLKCIQNLCTSIFWTLCMSRQHFTVLCTCFQCTRWGLFPYGDSSIIAIGYIRSPPYRCSPLFLQQLGPSVFTVSCLAHARARRGISSIWTFYKRLPCIN